MECVETNAEQSPECPVEENELGESDSADNFQKFIYELFDKNGILHDLRAYLRGHIVNVLKSAQTGEPPPCQKHFTQRLELASQALNIMIAEYLLQLEFTYSLSVFISEIPLSNMIFDFAKTLLRASTDPSTMRFKDSDVWSVLNYLGVKCDSEHALNIVQMYKSEDRIPLLSCILKCTQMYRKESVCMGEETSTDSLTSSANSLATPERRGKVHRNTPSYDKCKHYTVCKCCQNRVAALKEKYRRRKKTFNQNARKTSEHPLNVENFMKNINVVEKGIINEMFEQLKTVYEAEVEMVRREEESRLKRTLASHALQLQRRREEIEESLKTKEAELESHAQQKKRFLWGVARALRDQQHALAVKENNLKSQLQQAEESLRKKGEEMRVQITKELAILEGHLESMKLERDSLDKERVELDNLKSFCDSKSKIIEAQGEKEKADLRQNYDVLKDELIVLKSYVESTKVEPKCLFERSTMTEFVDFVPSNASVLNNTGCFERSSRTDGCDRETRPPNQVVNDLTKRKNVNFSQSKLDEVYREPSRQGSRSSASSGEAPAGEESARDDVIQRLLAENESLKAYAEQLRAHSSALWRERARAASAPRPLTAPVPAANFFTVHGVNPSTSARTFGWRKGAGEELSVFGGERARALRPGDPLPFVGVVRERHDNRRHLINQWRALRRRSSPLAGVSKARAQVPMRREMSAVVAQPSVSLLPAVHIKDEVEPQERSGHTAADVRQEPDAVIHQEPSATLRAKSPKTVLKEAKKNLRNKSSIKENPPIPKRDKSPTSMLREAKMRLRKLEIEAEAVEKSYMDFRKRQVELREERKSLTMLENDLVNDDIVKKLDGTRSRSYQNLDANIRVEAVVPSKETNDQSNRDFDKYLREYQAKFDIGDMHFKNKNTAAEKARPIPLAYSEVNPKNTEKKSKNYDYLSTPIMEFRRLYHTEKERTRHLPAKEKYGKVANDSDKTSDFKNEDPKSFVNLIINSQGAELEISKDIDTKITNKQEQLEQQMNNDSESHNIGGDDVRETREEKTIKVEIMESKSPENLCADHDSRLLASEDKISVSTTEDIIEYNKLETLRKIKNNKAVELEILKENIYKIYNLKSPPRSTIMPVEEHSGQVTTNISQEIDIENKVENFNDEKNVLRVEVESSCKVNKLKMSESQEGELVIVVQSSMNTKEYNEGIELEDIRPMTVTITPKDRSLGPKEYDTDIIETPKSKRSNSPEKADQLTRGDAFNAIFNADEDGSSIDMHLDLSKDDVNDTSDVGKDLYNDGDDYPDDFSQDVDNYNSPSEYGNNSPISLPKSSEQENFWDN